jgi:ABC-type glycerol-3-phosphate transport system substrate-binding protein
MKKQTLFATVAVVLLLAAGTVYAETPTLTVWDFKVSAGDASAKALKDLDVMFEASHGVKIEHVGYPSDPTYYSTLQAAAAANQGPDVVMFHADNRINPFADVLLSLDKDVSDVKGQFTPASIASVTVNGGIKLLPMTSQGFGIYYSKSAFKKAGLDPEKAPKSAAEFLAACEKLKAAGIPPILTGKDFTINFLFRCLMTNIVGGNNDSLATKDDVFVSKEFKEAATFVKTLVDKGYIEKAGLTRTYFMEAIDTFAAGKGGIFIGLLSDVANWKSFSDKQGIMNVGYFPTVNLPGAKYKDMQSAQPAGIGYGVFTWTKQSKLAVDYVKYVSTGEGAGRFATASGAVSPNMMIDTAKIPYPVLPVVIGYMKNGFSRDYQAFGQPNFEGDFIRLVDQAYVSGTMSIDKFCVEVQKIYHSK